MDVRDHRKVPCVQIGFAVKSTNFLPNRNKKTTNSEVGFLLHFRSLLCSPFVKDAGPFSGPVFRAPRASLQARLSRAAQLSSAQLLRCSHLEVEVLALHSKDPSAL